MTVIVDTNVAVVASGQSEQESEEESEDCIAACAERLGQINNGEIRLALDDQRRIIDEYRRNLESLDLFNIGYQFLKWVEINWTNPERCDRIEITPVDGPKINFEEFPDDSELETFDDDDRKFIAVAWAHPEKPPILQAVDRGWSEFQDTLENYGVMVEYLCEDYIQDS